MTYPEINRNTIFITDLASWAFPFELVNLKEKKKEKRGQFDIWELLCHAVGYCCEASVVAKFRFHAGFGLRNGSVIRPAAAFADFAQCKRGVSPAQDNRKGSRGMPAAALVIVPRFPKYARYRRRDLLKPDFIAASR